MLSFQPTRRHFMMTAAAISIASAVPDFAAPVSGKIQFGYAAITWLGNDRQAIDDIAAVGFHGIQVRANAVGEFTSAELKELLAKRRLTLVALSSGNVRLDAPEADEIAKHIANAKFLRDAGGFYLQVLDEGRGYPRSATQEECRRLGKLLTKIGKRTADLGVPLCYHNHLTTLSERPENLERILDASDPRYVRLEFDTAHFVAGGGDPAKAIVNHRERLLFIHLKDLIDVPANSPGAYPFRFVELGRGRVDLTAVFVALRSIRFSGWAIVELDHVPDPSRTARECAITSRNYLVQQMGVEL
jgi:inosose dehydratase